MVQEPVTPEVVGEEHHDLLTVCSADGKAVPSGFRDEHNPFSLVNITENNLREAILRLPDEYFLFDEKELYDKLKASPLDRCLRTSFWKEYERVVAVYQRTGVMQKMRQSNIFAGFCSREAFNLIFNNPLRLAYILLPLVTYEKRLEATAPILYERVMEILQMPIYDDRGRPNAVTAKVVLEAIKMVENRLYGTAVQRSSAENKTLQVSMTAHNASTDRTVRQTSDQVKALNDRVRELQRELHGIYIAGEPGQKGIEGITPADRDKADFIFQEKQKRVEVFRDLEGRKKRQAAAMKKWRGKCQLRQAINPEFTKWFLDKKKAEKEGRGAIDSIILEPDDPREGYSEEVSESGSGAGSKDQG